MYYISLETDWWALPNASSMVWICSAIHEILADKAFTVTDCLISQSFIFAFIPSTYMRIALIWGFPVQLSLWKSVHWLWRYKLNEVCNTVLNNLYLVIGHSEARRRKDVFQILYQLGVEFAFLCFSIKTSLVETLESFFHMLVMLGHVIRVDKYIIQIDHDIDIQKIRENIVHEMLESCRSIGKTKGHYRPFKWSIMCSKDSLPFITVSNVNQMVSMAKIYL